MDVYCVCDIGKHVMAIFSTEEEAKKYIENSDFFFGIQQWKVKEKWNDN